MASDIHEEGLEGERGEKCEKSDLTVVLACKEGFFLKGFTRQKVLRGVLFPGTVDQPKIVLREESQPACESSVDILL